MDYESMGCWATMLSDLLRAKVSSRTQEILDILVSGEAKKAADAGFRAVFADDADHITPEIDTLWWVSQTLKKFRGCGATDEERLCREAVDGFLARNSAVRGRRIHWSLRDLVRRALERALPEVPLRTAEGRFGPGNVMEGLDAVRRWATLENCDFHARHPETWLPSAAPMVICHVAGKEHQVTSFLSVKVSGSLDKDSDLEARLTAVDKDAWRKRLISVEPARQTFFQQWVRSLMMKSIHRGCLRGTPSDFLSFRDNVELQQLRCLSASRSRDFATIDLKDASDWISAEDVLDLFPKWLTPHLERCRTPYVRDGDQRHELWMYGGMGNATTFLVETLYFWAVFTAIGQDLRQCARATAFGDDIILSEDLADHPLFREWAEDRCGLVLNWDKSCIGRNVALREACGMVAYNGDPLTRLVRISGPGSGWVGRCRLCGLTNRLSASRLTACRLLARELWFLNQDIPLVGAIPCSRVTPWGHEEYWGTADLDVFLTQEFSPGYAVSTTETRLRYSRMRQAWEIRARALVGSERTHFRKHLQPWEALGVISGHVSVRQCKGGSRLIAPKPFQPRTVARWHTLEGSAEGVTSQEATSQSWQRCHGLV